MSNASRAVLALSIESLEKQLAAWCARRVCHHNNVNDDNSKSASPFVLIVKN